ncbi:SDR family NAD(P)-dependent oxidoreductase [Ferrimonas lipolytica]|uniref:SDR family NAD(P)-dependent oxidoreductase n=1 Tax=Ferrimonas lipolytica TaxID=2724191 RepID=A0A6H1UB64_9GAMM|nr:SDR family NAD(P)-dependent oxidoreductase [Ferrimonas lipolytica]QIZ76078.1 SDR family NAD(P)-dependent oxidoreductase [Ferrimonas lipolytica]
MILITGASSGLGAQIAQRYAQQGKSLLLSGRDQQRLQQVKDNCLGKAATHVTDLAEAKSVSTLFDALPQPPELIIHCAGSGYFGPLTEQQPQQIVALINNNLLSATLVLQQAVKRYQDQAVTVVVVMSTAAQVAKAGESSYCAVKWGVRGLVESLRLELKYKPMKLVAVYPGGMATEFWQTSGKDIDLSNFMSAAEAAQMLVDALQHSARGFVSDITINRTE